MSQGVELLKNLSNSRYDVDINTIDDVVFNAGSGVFLLGGYDLEMQEIKKILDSRPDILLFDERLQWNNANLSAYEPVLNRYGDISKVMIYGIELRENGAFPIPSNYCLIDHHNKYSTNTSALEQVAEILNIELTWEQKLIAANDRGYIPEMQRLGASPEEIRQIRFRDRMAQGVTEEDELLAVKAIEKRTIEQGVIIVQSESNRFSPVCDRLFPYEKLMIYTDDELMYYGQGKERLTAHFDSEIKAGNMFHGGGAEGYFGAAKGVYSVKEIVSLKNEIIQLINN